MPPLDDTNNSRPILHRPHNFEPTYRSALTSDLLPSHPISSVMISFPRTDWTGVRLGFPPYAPGNEHELAYAARKASLAWARAVATADWRAVDKACFQLSVYDKASEL